MVVVLKGFELLVELLADVGELWPTRVTSPPGRLDVVATRVVLCGTGTTEPAAVARDELLLVPDPFGIDAETVLLGLEGYVEVLLNGCELGGAGRDGAVTDCWEVRYEVRMPFCGWRFDKGAA